METTITTPNHDVVLDDDLDDDYIDDSNCSTPYVSAPSSPGARVNSSTAAHFFSTAAQPPPLPSGFFYSAPTSPMHYVLLSTGSPSYLATAASDASSNNSFEFEFSSRFDSPSHAPELGPSMSSADELFLNGQIRPMRLCAHLSRPQCDDSDVIAEEDGDGDDVCFERSSRNLRFRCRSQRRRTRSMSPLRTAVPFDWSDDVVETTMPKKAEERENESGEKVVKGSAESAASSSRCSSAGRSSKRWVFLKDFLRSKSEGRSNNKFWHNISFSPGKEKEKEKKVSSSNQNAAAATAEERKGRRKSTEEGKRAAAKRRSAHEMHYAANRAQAEEMRKKTFLPYRQGLLGCLGFNSKSYGAINGFARALNPVSSR